MGSSERRKLRLRGVSGVDRAGEGRALCESLRALAPSNLRLLAGEVEDERLPTVSSHSSSPRWTGAARAGL